MATYTYPDIMEMLVALRSLGSRKDAGDKERFVHFCLTHAARSHGQFLQDLWVLFELDQRRNGFFVEFGGADGVKFSNSCLLEREYGWSGILAEPARIWHPAIRRNRACFVDDRCVWTRTGEELIFNQPAIAAHSTIDSYAGADMHAATRTEGLRYPVQTISLNDLLAWWRAPRRIDYLSIDTEGSELDILKAFDFDAWDIRLITVEHNHSDQRPLLFEFLTSKGYQRRFETLSNVDDWYVKTYA